ncbi:hypothetical protein [Knoellia sp. LjRoot47]|uniref:hypothetical protein n=1 Tax=Knoellia sp. LjRoot47 TaxID=3342330 RepID=UPI003ECD0674
MSTNQLSTALRELVVDGERSLRAPDAGDLWAAGRRRRVTAAVVPLAVAACVVALVALVVWPSGPPRAALPAVRVDGSQRLMSYPASIAKPPFVHVTAAPGVTAALVPSAGLVSQPYAVSPGGSVTQVEVSAGGVDVPDLQPALSPDGRWVARGLVLTDLVRGVTTPRPQDLARLERRWTPPQEPSWWSPDSHHAFMAAFNQGAPRSGGVVIGVDGTMSEVPLLEGGLQGVFAGWLDDDTLLALLDLGPGTTRLEVRTWTIGDPSWSATGAVLSWSEEEPTELRALLSPDGQRLLLTTAGTDDATNQLATTTAMMFDPRTGARLGMPTSDGTVDVAAWAEGSFAGWNGWGCRPAWRDGLPVITDGGVKGFVNTSGRPGDRELVSVSSGYGTPCVAFAGNELRGKAVTDHALVWKERLWSWGLPLLGLALVALGAWAWNRRHRGSWRQPPQRRPMIITQPF